MPRRLPPPLPCLGLVALLGLACEPDPVGPLPDGGGEAPAIEDAQVPVPMDLLFEAEARRALLPDAGLSEASHELFSLWQAAGGWPITSEIVFPLSRPVEPAGLSSHARLLGAEGEVVAASVRLREDALVLTPAEPLTPGRSYVAFTTGLETPAGELHEEGRLFGALRSRAPLADPALEAVRTSLQPAFALVEAAGIAREHVLALTSFTTTDRPSVWFSPRFGKEPFPGEHRRDGATGLLRVPSLPDALAGEPSLEALREGLASSSGFSTTAPLWFETTSPAARELALSAAAVRLFRLTSEGPVEVAELERGAFPDGTRVWVRPPLTLEHSSTYAWVVTPALLAANGAAFVPQGPAALLQLSSPLVADGRSAVLGLDDEEALRLEPLRAALAPVHAELEPAAPLALAAVFETVKAPAFVFEHTDQLVERQVSTELSDVVVKTPFARGLWLAMPNVRTVATGTITTLDFLDPYTRRLREHGPLEGGIEFVLTIPEDVEPGTPIPVVLFGHGLITSRELVYGIADKLAREGYASFAIDLPLHGERSICLHDLHCAGSATCLDDGSCANADGSPGRLRVVESLFPHGPRVPVTTGQGFIDPLDLFGSRDHFLQGLVDLKQAVRVLQQADFAGATGGYVLDGDDIGYAGISLGGIFGAALSAVEPAVHSFALNVPGADLVRLMEDSSLLSTVLEQSLAERGVDEQSYGYFLFRSLARWALDPVDPLNLAHHGRHAPLVYTDPSSGLEEVMPFKRVILQMAEGDLVVPNSGTRALSDRTGVPIDGYTPLVSGHGFLFDPTSIQGALARQQIVDFLDGS